MVSSEDEQMHPGADAPEDTEAKQLALKQQKVARALMQAGIPKQFTRQDVSLRNYGAKGEQILREMGSTPEAIGNFNARLRMGAGFAVETDTPQDWELLPMITRGLLLSGVDARFMRIQHIAEWLREPENGDSRFESLSRARALVIQQLYTNDPVIGAEAPLPRTEMYRVENFLRDLMDAGVSISYGHTGDISQQRWWTENFVLTMQQNSIRVMG